MAVKINCHVLILINATVLNPELVAPVVSAALAESAVPAVLVVPEGSAAPVVLVALAE
jgi:hypothetical protein